jgi:hypothetical protein
MAMQLFKNKRNYYCCKDKNVELIFDKTAKVVEYQMVTIFFFPLVIEL